MPLIGLAGLGVVLFALPLAGLLSKTPWSRVAQILSMPLVTEALKLSLAASIASTALSALLGIPLAWVLARSVFPGQSLVRGVVTLPLVLPPVVGGAGLLFAFGRQGLLGGPLFASTRLLLPFSIWGVVMATTFVAMPFLVITVEGALRNLDPRYEGAAATLGARPWTVFRRVTMPMIGPSLAAGLVLAWARALGEFGATITFAGNLQGRTQTLPLAVYVALQSDRDTAVTISLVMIAISLAILAALRGRWWSASR